MEDKIYALTINGAGVLDVEPLDEVTRHNAEIVTDARGLFTTCEFEDGRLILAHSQSRALVVNIGAARMLRCFGCSADAIEDWRVAVEEKYKNKIPLFYDWLMTQHWRGDMVGELARKARADVYYPRTSRTYKRLHLYYIDKSEDLPRGSVKCFGLAWGEYAEYLRRLPDG